MDNCKHVTKVTPARDHSILNPQKWLCNVCGTTESVWACLSCSHVACGRFLEEHALIHYKETKHPLTIEVNEKYVFCYECDDYVLNDNAAGDIRLLRSTLSAIATQSFGDIESRGKRILRSKQLSNSQTAVKLEEKDKAYTALIHRRLVLMSKVFTAWRSLIPVRERPPKPPPPKKTPTPARIKSNSATPSSSKSKIKRKRAIVPGVTGLRNLGNTCYMNAILQVLSNLPGFQSFFLGVDPNAAKNTPARHSKRILQRQTTVECYEHLETPRKHGGLNGGGTSKSPSTLKKPVPIGEQQKAAGSLSQELHALFRVMWSGKWAIVSPHSMLNAVWKIIPFFKGYSQQDAQEFLCELLDKIENELQKTSSPSSRKNKGSSVLVKQNVKNIVVELFQGQLVSEVKCIQCCKISRTHEPFYELSLDFPERYQMTDCQSVIAQDTCHLEEMLAKFTETERLEGQIYACEQCNSRRRSVSKKPTVLTEAEKRFWVTRLPKVLRLHLKRFRWSGRNHREKINTRVAFDTELNMKPFCSPETDGPFVYQLSSVVIHHGRGFSSGHYTAYCYNEEADQWVHANDGRLSFCNKKEVLKSQAYILVYTRKDTNLSAGSSWGQSPVKVGCTQNSKFPPRDKIENLPNTPDNTRSPKSSSDGHTPMSDGFKVPISPRIRRGSDGHPGGDKVNLTSVALTELFSCSDIEIQSCVEVPELATPKSLSIDSLCADQSAAKMTSSQLNSNLSVSRDSIGGVISEVPPVGVCPSQSDHSYSNISQTKEEPRTLKRASPFTDLDIPHPEPKRRRTTTV